MVNFIKHYCSLRLAVLFAAAALAACDKPLTTGNGGVACSAFFKDARMLKAEDPVTQSGIAIGEVTGVTRLPDGRIEIGLSLDAKNVEATRAESLAFINEAGGRPRVELHPLVKDGPAIAEGARLEGVESRIGLEMRLAATRVGPAISVIKERVGQAVSEINAFIHSPEGQKLAADTKQFLVDAKERIELEVKEFKAKHPDFEENLKKQLERARQEGNKALIRVLQEIQESLADVEQSLAKEDLPAERNE